MHYHYQKVRVFRGSHLVHSLLYTLHEVHEVQPAPEMFRQPSLDVCVVETQNGDFAAAFVYHSIIREVRLSV